MQDKGNINQNQNIQQQQASANVKGVADIVLLIDITDSMQPALDALKDNLKKFADFLDGKSTKNQTKIQWRAKVIGYRDVEADGSNWWIENDFVDKVDALKNQISSLKADGGGDIPENTLDALLLSAKKIVWGEDKRHKFIILFTDAPTKEKIHKSNLEPGEADNVKYLMQVIAKKNIKLIIIAPNDNLGIFKTLSALRKSKMYPLGNEADATVYEGLKNQNFDELLGMVAATVSASSAEPVRT